MIRIINNGLNRTGHDGRTRCKGSGVHVMILKTCVIGGLDKVCGGTGGGGTSEGGVIEIHGLGMTVMEEECVGTSSLEEIGGRLKNDVDSMGEYVEYRGCKKRIVLNKGHITRDTL